MIGGTGITAAAKARGFAGSDFDRLDAVVNCVNAANAAPDSASMLSGEDPFVGTKSAHRTGIVVADGLAGFSARPCRASCDSAIEEVKSCNGYTATAHSLRLNDRPVDRRIDTLRKKEARS